MLAIKFKRIGKKHQPSFRIIVQEAREKVNGRNAEDIGWYNPRSKQSEIKAERAQYWLARGAQPTDAIHNLLVSKGIVVAAKRPVHARAKKKDKAAQTPQAASTPPEGAAPAPASAS